MADLGDGSTKDRVDQRRFASPSATDQGKSWWTLLQKKLAQLADLLPKLSGDRFGNTVQELLQTTGFLRQFIAQGHGFPCQKPRGV